MLISSTADVFQYISNGPDINFDKVLSSHDTVRQFLREATGEADLELGKIEWATAYTYVLSFMLIFAKSLILHSVNVRMATTFGSRRAFLVGGL